MPGRDRTGPQGLGSKTGRGLGPCGAGIEEVPVSERDLGFFRRLGRGLGFGRAGRGRGMGRGRNRNY